MTNAFRFWHAVLGDVVTNTDFWWILVAVVVTVLVSLVVGKVQYDRCIETGLTEDQCVFMVSCPG